MQKVEQITSGQSCLKSFNIAGKSYSVDQITDASYLQKLLDKGLVDLYRDVFGAPPYNEVFRNEEVEDIFFDYLKSKGKIFILKHFENEKPLAFMIGTPIGNKFNDVLSMKNYIKDRRTAYLADDGVDVSIRRAGVSTFLKTVFLKSCQQDQYDQVILRTRSDNYCQISAVNKASGVILNDVQQDVTRTVRGDNTIKEDNRFFLFNFRDEDNVKTDILKEAKVIRMNGKDSIIIEEPLPKGLSEQNVLSAYPAAESIYQGRTKEDHGETIFNGHMYISRAKLG